jgi:hypothetical protein
MLHTKDKDRLPFSLTAPFVVIWSGNGSRDLFCLREVVHLKGRGHPYKVNKITARGKKLLQELNANE